MTRRHRLAGPAPVAAVDEHEVFTTAIQPDLGDDERVHQACLSALKDSRRFVTCSSRVATAAADDEPGALSAAALGGVTT